MGTSLSRVQSFGRAHARSRYPALPTTRQAPYVNATGFESGLMCSQANILTLELEMPLPSALDTLSPPPIDGGKSTGLRQ